MVFVQIWAVRICFYYVEESVLLGTKPLVDSIRHFIRDPSGVFSVCHLCECRIVQWRHDSRLLLLLNWFLASRLLFRIKSPYNKKNFTRWLEDMDFMFSWQDCSCHSNIKFISSRHRVISSIYYIDTSVLLENRPLVKPIRNHIRDSSGVFSISSLVRKSMLRWYQVCLLNCT